jgi:hypothetical protein
LPYLNNTEKSVLLLTAGKIIFNSYSLLEIPESCFVEINITGAGPWQKKLIVSVPGQKFLLLPVPQPLFF